MKKKNIPETSQPDRICGDIIRLLRTQNFAVLATTNGVNPHTSLIAFASADNGSVLIFLTPKLSKKYKNIQKNPRVSLLIDSRPGSISSISTSCALTISGLAKKMASKDCIRLSSTFFKRHPFLNKYAADPMYALIFIKVKSIAHANSLSQVTRVKPGTLLHCGNNC